MRAGLLLLWLNLGKYRTMIGLRHLLRVQNDAFVLSRSHLLLVEVELPAPTVVHVPAHFAESLDILGSIKVEVVRVVLLRLALGPGKYIGILALSHVGLLLNLGDVDDVLRPDAEADL